MAKMKVHELAKELDILSKDVITYLAGNGIEVKAAQSALDDDAVAMVRKQFGAKAEVLKAETPKAAAPTAEAPKAAAAESPRAAEPAVAEVPKAAPATEPAAAEVPKKKKKIIIVSNSGNSKMSNGNRPGQNNRFAGQDRNQGQDRRSGQSQGSQNRNQAGRTVTEENPYRPLLKPSVKPSPVSNDYANRNRNPQPVKPQQTPAQETEGAVRNTPVMDQPVVKQPQMSETESKQPVRGGNERRGDQRNAGSRNFQDNRQGQNGRSEGRSEGRRMEGGSRPGYQNSQRPQNGNNGVGKPYNNSERGQRPDSRGEGHGDNRGEGRGDNRFKKQGQGKGFAADSPMIDEKRGQNERRNNNQDRDKKSKKDMIYEDDEKMIKNNKAGRFIKPEKKVEEPEEQIKVITIPEKLTIKDLADKMKMQPSVIIKKLFLEGKIVTLNTEVSYEEAENIAIDYDIMCEQEVQVDIIEELLKEDEEDESKMVKRPPVVCVMGHVDHGKTSLLDAIRKTNVTDREAGGITQAIGAYTVNVNGEKITFLDTPGHEAFTAMRMRGANATDIAILVVAADDGVMPQTVEAINHAKAAGVEIIVAVNKIDKPAANPDKVKQELMEYELVSSEWGGSTECVNVSAKSGEGIEDLLETILLTADILELKADKKRKARGLVIEAELDKGRGPVATILVQKGTLKVGDFISAGASFGKVRAMIDDKGRRVKEATPSTPVEILGLSDVPAAGEVFIAHDSDKTAKSFAETYKAQHKEQMLADTKARMSLDDLFSQIKEGDLKELNIIIKADVQGSVEAVKQSLMKLSNEEVIVKCIHGGVGAINESDVSLAAAANAIIIGFNVKPDPQARATAEREKVDVRLYDVIYKAIEDVERAMKGMLDPIFEEKVIGHAEVRQIFKASAVGNIAGSYILDGEFKRDCKIRIRREGEQIYEGQLASLKRFKDDVKEVKAGFECGLVFEGFDQMQELDIVEAYIMVEVPR